MGPVAGLAEIEARPPNNDVLAEADETLQGVFQPHLPRLPVIEGQHVDAEARLQLGEAVELVQHHLGRRVTADLDYDAHAGAIALVAHFANAFDELGADEFGDALQQGLLVHLIGDFGDDDRLPILADVLDLGFGADDDGIAAGFERAFDAGAADNGAAGREVGAGHDLHQIFQARIRVGDQRQRGVDDFTGVVRRDIGCHADGDAVGAVDQQVGEFGRQNLGFVLAFVVVGLEFDGFLVDILQQHLRRLGQPDLSIAHRRGVIAVDRAEVALAVDQGHAQRERLRHAHHGVVNGGIAVRMVLTHDVADNARRFAVGLVGGVAGLMHSEQDAPMHRLQPIAGIRQRARDDHAHGVIEVRAAHLVFQHHRDRNAVGVRRLGGEAGCLVVCIAQAWLVFSVATGV